MLSRIAVAVSLTAVLFGPPSIKVESVNPATARVKGAVLMVSAHHHQDTAGVTVTGRAEGLIAGKRVTRPLTLIASGGDGEFGVKPQWDAGQPWLLIFSINTPVHDDTGVAEAVVKIAPDGKVMSVDYPMGKLTTGTPWPRRIAPKEVDAILTAMAKQ